jgi:hypothetical protein
MTLQGKGFFIRSLPECEGGEPDSILAISKAAGLSHVLIKIADGGQPFGVDATSEIDTVTPVVQALHTAGISVWGWHPVYGSNPSAEAATAIARTQALELDGYVVEAKEAYCRPGMSEAAQEFMSAVRAKLKIPIALSSYRFPNYHPELPWSTFLEFCDLHMPQVFWEQSQEAGTQLRESRRQCDSLPTARPFVPTGPAYATSVWSPTAEEILDFLNTAKAMACPAVNFFNWDTCRQNLPHLWKTAADFSWPTQGKTTAQPVTISSAPSDEFLSGFLDMLNGRQAARASAFYAPDAIQVRGDQILQGIAAIQSGYTAFFETLPTGTGISISQEQVEEDQHIFFWKAGAVGGETTLLVESGKIIREYTFFV